MLFGVSGFFTPRFPPPQLQPPGTPSAISFYDTTPLKATLERLVDFDRVATGAQIDLGEADELAFDAEDGPGFDRLGFDRPTVVLDQRV